MSLTSQIKADSVRNYPDGTYTGRVTTMNSTGLEVEYFCRILANGKFDSENVYYYHGGKWNHVELSDHLLEVVKKPFLQLVYDLSNAFKRKATDAKGRKCLAMWEDTVIDVSFSPHVGHLLKVGGRLFYTDDCMTLASSRLNIIKSKVIGEQQKTDFDLSKDNDTYARVKKLFDLAYGKYMASKRGKPIGLNTYADLQNARKEFGASSKNAKELDRSRR